MGDCEQTGLSPRRLAGNVLWNLGGQTAPVLSALVFVPILVRGLGTERFGVLAIAWVVVGYFSLFDLGLGRALTKVVAERLGADERASIPGLVWNGLLLMGAFGLVGSISLVALAHWLAVSGLRIPEWLHSEAVTVFLILSAAVPVVIISAGLRGILEAYQRFSLITAVNAPLGIITFAGPAAVLPFSKSLVASVGVLTTARLTAAVVFLCLCSSVHPGILRRHRIDRQAARMLLSFGGWMTVSNVVSPLMTYMDRFMIGARVSLSAVAYYAAPYDLVNRLLVVPSSLMGVMFPAFSAAIGEHQPQRAARLSRYSVSVLVAGILPIVLILVTFAPEGLRLWLGAEFARQSAPVLRILAGAILVNSVAQVPFALIQSCGRPDLTAKLHLAELPIYLGVFVLLVARFGIVGAAAASLVRVGMDTVGLFLISGRLQPGSRLPPGPVALVVAAGAGLLLGASLIQQLALRSAFFGLFCVGYGVVMAKARIAGGQTLPSALARLTGRGRASEDDLGGNG